MGLRARLRGWQAAHKERRVAELTLRAADIQDDKQYDLLLLHKRGFLRARGTGESITRVYARIENLIRKRITVIITPGTYFVSSGGHQNMATTRKYTFSLEPVATLQLAVDAVCINANRPIPRKSDHFDGLAHVSDEVGRFLEASKDEDPMVIQAGVWTLTDKYTRSQVINHLIARDSDGGTSHPITNDHCDRAKAILESLGISHKLYYSSVAYEKKSITYTNGTYVGEFRYGERHGRGKYTWKDGNSYDGEWVNGEFSGNGKYTWQDGDFYEGKWEGGRRVGGWFRRPDGFEQWQESEPGSTGRADAMPELKLISCLGACQRK